jgi:hypothetical protein
MLLVCLAPAALRAEPALQWRPRAEMPFGVFMAAGARQGEQFFVTGGLMRSGEAGDWVQVYDIAADRWHAPMQFAQGRCLHAHVSLADGRVLIAGGQTGRVTDGLRALAGGELLDMTTRQTAPTADLPWVMPTATGHGLSDGRAIIIGGRGAAVFDPSTNTWVSLIEMHESRHGHASLLLDDGRVVVVGGDMRGTIEVIDVAAGVSQLQAARLPEAMDDMAVAPLMGDAVRVLILGGQRNSDGDTTDATWVLDLSDPSRSTIEPGPALGIDGGVADHRVVVIGPYLVAVGGETQRDQEDTELAKARIIDRRTLEVFSLRDCATPHDDALAFAVGDTVWVVGGYYHRSGVIGSVPLHVATRAVEALRLPAARLNGSR